MTTPDPKQLADEAKTWISQVVIAAHRHSPAQTKVAVEALEAFIDQLASLAAPVAAIETLDEVRKQARREVLGHFRHEHGQDFADAKKWREWIEAQRLIEEEMPEGYSVVLECGPGDWGLNFRDPEGENIEVGDYDDTAGFIRAAVEIAKKCAAAAPAGAVE